MSLNVTLDDVQSKVAAIVDQDEVTSNISSTDYSLRRAYINMAQREWAESYDWRSLYREYNMRVSTSTGNASIALPTDFRKLASRPAITYDGSTTAWFSEIVPTEKGQYGSSDRYVYVMGDPNANYTMVVHAPTLSSGASTFVPYYRSVVSLVSPSNVVMCPNPEYLVQRTIAYYWESQSDNRFQQAKFEADKILKRLLEQEQTYGQGYVNSVPTIEKTTYGFRWGKS